jgi:hypothetical protein
VSRITYAHHPNDYAVAALAVPRLEAIFAEMGAVSSQVAAPFVATRTSKRGTIYRPSSTR